MSNKYFVYLRHWNTEHKFKVLSDAYIYDYAQSVMLGVGEIVRVRLANNEEAVIRRSEIVAVIDAK